jgi:hypothetical protein
MGRRDVCPKRGLNIQLVHRLNDAANVVTEDLTQHFIRHGGISLTPYMIAKLRLNHAEGAFDVGPLVIVPQELLAAEGKVMKHLFPQPASRPAVDTLEGNIGGGPMAGNDLTFPIYSFGMCSCGFPVHPL